MSDPEPQPGPEISLYWSVRSPFCYLALHRLRRISTRVPPHIVLKPVYPVALRKPKAHGPPGSIKAAYNFMDATRVARMLDVPLQTPDPDPLETVDNNETHAHLLTRLLAAVRDDSQRLNLADGLSQAIFAGQASWATGPGLNTVIAASMLDPAGLFETLDANRPHIERRLEDNAQEMERAGHWGVPLMVWRNEPFFGQDRVDVLEWTLQEAGF